MTANGKEVIQTVKVPQPWVPGKPAPDDPFDDTDKAFTYTINDSRHGMIRVTKRVYHLVMKDKAEACPQRTEEWYQRRMNHLTASALAAACGENPYETRMKLFRRKIGQEPAFEGNAATRHGQRHEPDAIRKYEEVTGEKVLEFGLLGSVNEGEEFLAGSPDGITASGIVIEVKCPKRRKPAHHVPAMYMHQVQMLMRITRGLVCDFVQYVPADLPWTPEQFIITRVSYDDAFWKRVFPLAQSFWEDVVNVRKGNIKLEDLESPLERRRRLRQEEKITKVLNGFPPLRSLRNPPVHLSPDFLHETLMGKEKKEQQDENKGYPQVINAMLEKLNQVE